MLSWTDDPPRAIADRRFKHFYEEQFAVVVRLARLLTSDSNVAEDIAQDAFVKVCRYAALGVRPIENPAALLRTTTINLCRSWHTSQHRAALRMARHGPDATRSRSATSSKGTVMKTDDLLDRPDSFEARLRTGLDHIAGADPVAAPGLFDPDAM